MRIEWRPPRWDDWVAVVGLYFTPLLALKLGILTRLPPRWLPLCGLKTLTGVPCPTCGAYRAACALMHGRIAAALRLQPLLSAVSMLLAVLCLYAAASALLRLPRPHVVLDRRARRGALWLSVLVFAANWAYLLLDGR